ncbi:hypothetical protein EDD76_11282 [Kineothrix alysoides]|uniref:Uncharacterized protein n=1 Tax=Kineothrix alysoides TaxID=1469948 RepID=A0A4R1QXC3_9FIRM|nr:hypothetical protein [Kineothrix alysoides]TCL56254.1 hypothetical protein EDD76_11282 [Kineothrix alysoides]
MIVNNLSEAMMASDFLGLSEIDFILIPDPYEKKTVYAFTSK